VRGARGGIVLGWLFKIIVMLAIIGVIAFETGAVVVSKVTADRIAIDAADEAGRVYFTTGSSAKAQAAAEEIAKNEHATVIKFNVVNAGKAVELTVRKRASTFIVQHIGPLKKFAIADSTHLGQVR
jgi:hypothetical protein